MSDVDGANGRLIIRGTPVEELARSATAESVDALLLDGFFDDMPKGQKLAAAIGAAIERTYSSGFRASLETVRNPYGEGGASQHIVRVLRDVPPEELLSS